MPIAYKDERIICAYGHAGGHVRRDVTGDRIGPEDIAIIDGGNHTDTGHYCLECRKISNTTEAITRYSRGAYSVLTPRGWVGHIG